MRSVLKVWPEFTRIAWIVAAIVGWIPAAAAWLTRSQKWCSAFLAPSRPPSARP